jgi:hypothetical protein
MKLPNYIEFVGTLKRYDVIKGQCHLFFTISKTIDVPIDAISHEALERLVGKKIGVINADGRYRLREVTK